MSKNQNNPKGIFLALLYCITSAFSLILVNRYEQHLEPITLLFYNFSITAFVFIVFVAPKSRVTTALSKKNFSSVVWVNMATIFAWMPVFYSLKYLDPAIVIGIIFGTIPIASIVIGKLTQQENTIARLDLVFALLILSILGLMSYDVIHHATNATADPIALSLALAFLAGCGTAWCVQRMKKLNSVGFSATQVMAVRFFGIIIFSIIFLWVKHAPFLLSIKECGQVLTIVLLSAVLPLYLLQKGIEYTTPVTVSFILPLQPLITYVLQWWQGEFHLSFALFALIMSLSAIILVSAFFKAKQVWAIARQKK